MSEASLCYAIRTKPNREYVVSQALREKGYEVFLPLRRKCTLRPRPHSSLEAPLFPSYLFCRFDVTNRLPILTVPGVFHIVACGKTPLAIDEEEIQTLKAIVNNQLPLQDHSYLAVGQEVMVYEGPLAGTRGKIANVNGVDRFAVSITILQRTVSVEMDPAWLVHAGQGGL